LGKKGRKTKNEKYGRTVKKKMENIKEFLIRRRTRDPCGGATPAIASQLEK